MMLNFISFWEIKGWKSFPRGQFIISNNENSKYLYLVIGT